MPRLSVGLPIFNGENYGEAALRSLLSQTYDDFELIIADNASTDRTAEICRTYATQDERIRYFRHEKNLGAAYNFNFTYAKAESEFFKWASHDDVLEPTYLERCVGFLAENPEFVLCHSRTRLIDDQGKHLKDDDYPMRLDSDHSQERFGDLAVIRHDCFLVFGVIRRHILAQTPLIGNYVGSDRVLLCELGMHGKFHEVPEFLFSRRRHGAGSCQLPERQERVTWFDPAKVGTITYPNWRILRECVAAVRRVRQPGVAKLKCHLQVPVHFWARRKFLTADLVEGVKLSLKKTETGHRLFYWLKRNFKPGPRG